jgi:hypothetical protein
MVQAVDDEGVNANSGGDTFEYNLAGPTNGFKNFRIHDLGTGQYKLSLNLVTPKSHYELTVEYKGQPLSNSPFRFETLS